MPVREIKSTSHSLIVPPVFIALDKLDQEEYGLRSSYLVTHVIGPDANGSPTSHIRSLACFSQPGQATYLGTREAITPSQAKLGSRQLIANKLSPLLARLMQRLSNKSTAVRPKVIFSGIQPTGIPHLGNYVGALRQWVQLQHHEPKDTKLIYSIVDLHAITTPQSPEKLKQWKRESLAALLAVGIDPERSILFYQSSVCGYTLVMVGAYVELNSLFCRATHVPVGHDQQQHLEFARECVTNFNHAYGECLIQPKTITPPVHRVMSLSDPTSKMSKSHKLARSRILITDTPDEIRLKISSALTDSVHGISYDPALRPGISNLLSLFSIFDAEKRSPEQLAQAYSDTHPRLFKDMVSDAITLGLQGIRTRYTELIDGDTHYLDHVAAEGARKALQSAEETMGMVRTAVGL
ncbi:tryptophanyl-tRNA synthetase [Metarhizium acridum CQMa 102]|uniref:tryptophan--tRNA ligase n=1 Tax=Metarhizium acridum (strain CQMa 102) TaxID=655827 RepID=E9E9B3_METAQ|nr:tryptophanyl-tRNA synthetase [Metarhizium acridum CQMa 102]EFY87484.1 tryptophanyl-tRNA synthetase [Metarhizium acridum CQMa 102]